tara:strand:+ start:36 stop:578 length:543 start_codon:yes stop_codon:yes gene_type:complete
MDIKGDIYWITGLAGAGKSSIGKLFFNKIKTVEPNTIFLDGDELRSIFNVKNSFSIDSRISLSYSYSKICNFLANQNLNVVIATISMFEEIRTWNKKNIHNYNEIYIKVPMNILLKRDQKKLYSRAIEGKIDNVIGIDIKVDEPKHPDLICVNDGSKSLNELADEIFNFFKKSNKMRNYL